MIKAKINQEFPHHNIIKHTGDIYVADYTEQTSNRRGVEILDTKPSDIESFFINNPKLIEVGAVIFDNYSFTYSNGNAKSQCEACLFPYQSKDESWILFTELKYSSKSKRNRRNLRKAICQLYKTRYHYLDERIFDKRKNRCYLIASLPQQDEPFPNFILDTDLITRLKIKHNVILRLTNSVKILDDKMLDLT